MMFVMNSIHKNIFIILLLITQVMSNDYANENDKNIKPSQIDFDFNTTIIAEDTFLYETIPVKIKTVKNIKKNSHLRVYETRFIKGYTYPWYKVHGGWVNGPYLYLNKNEKIKTQLSKIKSNIIEHNSTTKTKHNEISLDLIINQKDELSKKNIRIKEDEKKPKDNYYSFIGLSLGYSTMNVTKQNITGDLQLSEELSYKTINNNIEIGLKNKKATFTINYENLKYKDVTFNRYLIGAFKSLNYTYKPYVGVLLGVSYIKLTKSHINAKIIKKEGKVTTYGAQFGIDKQISKKFSFHSYIRYLNAKHNTLLKSSTQESQILRNQHLNINIGIRYLFDF